jgi:hypothetical protein
VFRHVSRPASLALTAAVALYGAACASAATRARREELLDVAKLGLAQIERARAPVIIVIGPHVTAEALSTLKQLRKVITPGQVPETERYRIPEGYFVLQQLSLRGAGASFVGTAGPSFRNHPDSCGSTIDVAMQRGPDGAWRVASVSVTQC